MRPKTLLILLFLMCGITSAKAQEKHDEIEWETWSQDKVKVALSAGKPVFVEFFAKWCLRCKLNRKQVLENSEVSRLFTAKKILLLRADWTSRDSKVSDGLATLGTDEVPTYVLYVPKAQKPVRFPALLKLDHFIETIESKLGPRPQQDDDVN